jgi:hypothetical protein
MDSFLHSSCNTLEFLVPERHLLVFAASCFAIMPLAGWQVRATSAAMSDGAGAGAMECRTGPIACIREGVTHHRSTVSCSPNSLATLPTDRPLVATRSTASRLKACGNIRHPPPGSKA